MNSLFSFVTSQLGFILGVISFCWEQANFLAFALALICVWVEPNFENQLSLILAALVIATNNVWISIIALLWAFYLAIKAIVELC